MKQNRYFTKKRRVNSFHVLRLDNISLKFNSTVSLTTNVYRHK
jgi:hypothetical protein